MILVTGNTSLAAGSSFTTIEVTGNANFNTVSGNVGVGTWTAPANLLDVSGSQAIGAGYAGITAAPANGLIVQGNVGVGSTAPGANLEQIQFAAHAIRLVSLRVPTVPSGRSNLIPDEQDCFVAPFSRSSQ